MVTNASQRSNAQISVLGAGIAGTWQALLFAKAGHRVTLYERDDEAITHSSSHWAGGMLAPWCEREASEPLITRLGARSLDLWREELPDTAFNGSLVVAHARDRNDFERFARLAPEHERLAADGVGNLEPQLAGRFREGLLFAGEAHVEPRDVLPRLHRKLADNGVALRFSTEANADDLDGIVIDCRGLGARDRFSDLRGVKGETVVVETSEVSLARPIRLIHPRWPLYVIPRPGNRYLIGATTIETEDSGVSVRSALELLSAAYALHPAFGEARIVEIGSGLRPAFPDNLPRIVADGENIGVNGLYRHGFLLAPALAELTLNYVSRGAIDNEVMRCQ